MAITINDLSEVYKETFDARSKWRNVLLALKVGYATIDSIGVRWRDNPDDCYREGLAEWLKGGERTWSNLARALSDPIVGHRDLAMIINEQKITLEPDDYPNQKIGNDLVIYVKQKVGVGAFGAVFKGSYQNRPCAVKVLLHDALEIQTSLLSSPDGMEESVRAFERECEFVKSFKHLNVVEYLSTEKHPTSGHTMLVTELMDCNLRNFFSHHDKKSLTTRFEISLSKDVASGLAYIHSNGIIHRDICGDNILLKLDQAVPIAKISDFGMSRLLDLSTISSTLTAMGHRMGYLPPEASLIEADQYDQTLDVFSFGVIMVQIASSLETVKSVRDRLFHASQISEAHVLKPFIRKCLQESSIKRPCSLEICTLLRKLFAQESVNSQSNNPSLPLIKKSRKGENIPVKMGRGMQSFVIGGSVFVGGGDAANDFDRSTVMKLDVQKEKWSKLPQYAAVDFCMVSAIGKLILIGGQNQVTRIRSNQIAVLESEKWTYPYSPMARARSFATAISYRNYIIVAGGIDDQGRFTSSVEVFDMATNTWYPTQPLHNPQIHMKFTLVGDMLYLMGGVVLVDSEVRLSKAVHRVDAREIINNLKMEKQESLSLRWQIVASTPLEHSTPLCVGNYLLALGGRHSNNTDSSVHVYQSDTNSWEKCGDLPIALYGCTSALLPNGTMIVAGGEISPYNFVDTVHYFLLDQSWS